MLSNRLVVLALLVMVTTGCESGCRGLAPEATTMVGQAFRDCANLEFDALWAVTSDGFREITERSRIEAHCQTLSERVGAFRRIDNVTGVNRQVNANGNFLSLTLETTFEVGSVDASAIVTKVDGEWRLQGFQIMGDDAPMLDRDDASLPPLALEHARRFASGDFEGFHGAFAPELQEVRPLSDLAPALENLVARHGSPDVVDEPSVTIDGDEHRVAIPLQYPGGRAAMMLTYQWRGAAWTLLRYDVRTPPAGSTPPPSSGKP